MELDYQAIGVRIRRLRKERGLTQQTLAEISSQEPSNISHIERGATKLSLPTLVSIANALEVTGTRCCATASRRPGPCSKARWTTSCRTAPTWSGRSSRRPSGR